ncbi:MAG: enoyl-CoA hydratase-related protein, partial [Chloroflexota bacterium]|nr:enoyl-CoA hydratase-related protein [Chloroflexota bacterium]
MRCHRSAGRPRLLWRVRGAARFDLRGDPVTEAEPFVLVERDAARRVALLRLNRPRQLNALNGEVMDQLCDALETLDRDDGIRCVVVT